MLQTTLKNITGRPTLILHLRHKYSGTQYPALLSKSLKYSHQWSQLQDAGVTITEPNLSKDMSVKLFEFEQPNNKEYWVGLPNFYVITRYNHSPLYAMASISIQPTTQTRFNAITTAKVEH